MSESVEIEWLCAQILRKLGFAVGKTEIAVFDMQKVLVVERFDRQWINERWIARLPQEDFCQTLAVPPDRKYESDGGPGIEDALKLLSGSASSNADREQFLLVQMAFWLLAATDGHAKNFSVFHHAGDSYRMTPLYDVLSAWPVIGHGAKYFPWKKRGWRWACAPRTCMTGWGIFALATIVSWLTRAAYRRYGTRCRR